MRFKFQNLNGILLSQHYLFSDWYSQISDTGEEDSDDDDSRPFSLFEMTNYGRICQDLSSALQSSKSSANLCELAEIHNLYRTLARQSPRVHSGGQKLQAVTLAEILANSRDSLLENRNIHIDEETVFSEPVNHDDQTICRHCNKIQLRHGNSILRLESALQSRSQWLDQNQGDSQEDTASDKCIGTDDLTLPDDTCVCDAQSDLVPYMPSNFLVSSKENNDFTNHEKDMYNANQRTINTVENVTVQMETLEVRQNDRVPRNGMPMSEFVTFDKINTRPECSTNFYGETGVSHYYMPLEHPVNSRQDDDYDCISNVSEDSEYMMQQSKLSKFLCVGVGKSKSKTPYKPSKQASAKNESKKITSKLKELKMKAQSKSRESLKSPDPLPSNKGKSCIDAIIQESQEKQMLMDRHQTRSPHNIVSHSTFMRDPSSHLSSPIPTSHAPTPEGYDSGHDSGLTHCGTSDKTVNWAPPHDHIHIMRHRGQLPQHLGQPHIQSGNSQHSQAGGSLGTTTSLGESSGYESIPRDSECSSFSSSQESEVDEEHKREGAMPLTSQGAIPRHVQVGQPSTSWSDQDRHIMADIEQARRARQQQVLGLKATQNALKAELARAKATLNVPDDSWNYERKSNVRVLELLLVFLS